MKILLTVLAMTFCVTCFGQNYEYAMIIHELRIGGKASFSFGTESKNDSAAFYPKFKTIVDAMNYADRKGWEPIQIFESTSLLNVILRRKTKPRG